MIRFRAIRLRAQTDDFEVGFDAAFENGLVVVSGQNSVGKSLLFQSLVYGLGLEGMYGPSRQHGLLTRAMTEAVKVGGQEFAVRSSWVTVEIENDRDEILTARRAVAGEADSQLVAVWEGPALTSSAGLPQRHDYFVRRGGAATSAVGFHRRLAEFIGWELPLVPTFSDSEVPLYLELLFSLFVVEQKSGWAGALPRLPTYLQIRDPLQRSIEFILDLSLLERARARQRLTIHEAELRRRYESTVATLETTAHVRGARMVGLEDWQSLRRRCRGTGPVVLEPYAEGLEGSSWVPVENLLDGRAAENDPVDPAPENAPSNRPSEPALNARLAEATDDLRDVAGRLNAVEETMDMVHAQLGSLRTRIETVEEERRRYDELRTLVSLGSPVAVATFSHRDCPTCLRSLEGLEHQPELSALDYDQSLRLLTEQLRTLRALQVDADRSVESQLLVRQALELQAEDLRREVRAIRSDLLTPEAVPSIADLQRRLQREAHVDALRLLRADVVSLAEAIGGIAVDLRQTLRSLDGLGSDELTPTETATLELWTSELRSDLTELGVTTFPVDSIVLPVSGKPVVDGYDVGFQSSASDIIRLRWAYALSLLRAANSRGGHHAGVLMMDEPRQQEVESFPKFLELAAQAGGQVIVVTSEPVAAINEWLDATGETAQVIELGGPLLRVDPSADF
jgi:hypothetical protein